MRIHEHDVTYIFLSAYLLTLTSPIKHLMDHTQVNLIQLKTFELKLDFAEYIQYTDVRIADCGSLLGPLYTIYRVWDSWSYLHEY